MKTKQRIDASQAALDAMSAGLQASGMKPSKGMTLKTAAEMVEGDKFRWPPSQRSRRETTFYVVVGYDPTPTGTAGAGTLTHTLGRFPSKPHTIFEVLK